MKKIALILWFVGCGLLLYAQASHPNLQYKLIGHGSVQAKNYYLLSLLQQNGAVRHLLESDAVLRQIATDKTSALKASLNDCTDHFCFTQKLKFSDIEIKTIGDRLVALYTPTNALGTMVKNELIASGTYALYRNLMPRQILVKAWQIEAAGINNVIEVYAEGKKPAYPLIDSISFNVQAKSFDTQMFNAAATIFDGTKNTRLFFQQSLTSALIFLDINERTDAANDEPMAAGINKAAIKKSKTVNWAKYKYSVILVPGAGPAVRGTALSAEGMLRCRLGANRYFEGFAPFIMTSGGKVHPYKTRYCEADEMQKYLVQTLHVPANAVIVDPMARHTTTNLRNGVRLIYRYGFPFNKAAITCTDKSQSGYIGTVMADRCMKELGYVPYKLGAKLSDTEREFYPAIEALQINPIEPLDP
jgi:hypothetical protein